MEPTRQYYLLLHDSTHNLHLPPGCFQEMPRLMDCYIMAPRPVTLSRRGISDQHAREIQEVLPPEASIGKL